MRRLQHSVLLISQLVLERSQRATIGTETFHHVSAPVQHEDIQL